jgi:hypothetical protein
MKSVFQPIIASILQTPSGGSYGEAKKPEPSQDCAHARTPETLALASYVALV